MQTTALLCFPSSFSPISHSSSKISCHSLHKIKCSSASSNVEVNGGELLSARERRELRNKRREEAINSKPLLRDVVEEKLSTTRKKSTLRYQMDLDTLADEGVSWWGVLVRKTSERTAAKNLFTAFRRQYPSAELEIFVPEIPSKKELKNGSYSNCKKIVFPGYIYIKCLLNKEIHDFIRYSPSIRGFSATKVGNSMKWIMRPTTISNPEMERMIKRFHEEQEKYNCEIEDELAKGKRNKAKDNLLGQGHPEALKHEGFSIGKKANFRRELFKELRNINRSGTKIGSFDAKFNSKKLSELFTNSMSTRSGNVSSLKGLRQQKDSNGRERFPSKQDSKLIAGSTDKVTSGRVKEFDLET